MKGLVPALAVLFCAGIFFSGCADSTPAIVSVDAAVVYDYASADSEPSRRLSVFVQSSSETARIMELTVSHPDTGIRWEIRNPLVVSNGSQTSAGSANLMPPYFSSFPRGQYQLTYTDLAGKTAAGSFYLDYQELTPDPNMPAIDPPPEGPAEGEEAGPEPAVGGESSGPVKKIAVYGGPDGGGVLFFFDKARQEWATMADIQAAYPDARSLRICLDYPGGQVRYLLPPKNLEGGGAV